MPTTFGARLAVAAAAILGVVILGVGGYFLVYQPRLDSAQGSTSAVALPSAAAAPPTGQADGQWSITGGSFAGYRVREQLADLTAPSDAVGRTNAVTGGFTLKLSPDGSGTVTGVSVQADLSSLQSDSRRRDGFVQRNALETARYPNAGFTAAGPVPVPKEVIDGAAGTIKVSGQWEIHGQSQPATLDLQVRRNGGTVEVVGSYPFQWGDFGVEQPRTAAATVTGNPVIELSLVLARTAG